MAGVVERLAGGHGTAAAADPLDAALSQLASLASSLDQPVEPGACPRCGDHRIYGWGKCASGRRRQGCRGCRRTFSVTTDTSLRGIHELGKLRPLLAEMIGGGTRSCRALAVELELGKNTVWRWRSKIMAALETLDAPLPEPVVASDLHVVRESRKASREWVRHTADPERSPTPNRPRWIDVDSGRSPEPLPRAKYRVPLLAAVDDLDGWRAVLFSEQGSDELDGGSASSDQCTMAGTLEAAWARHARHATMVAHRRPVDGDAMPPDAPGALLRRFLEPFRGPATRHLRGYLAWFGATRPDGRTDRLEQAWALLLTVRPT